MLLLFVVMRGLIVNLRQDQFPDDAAGVAIFATTAFAILIFISTGVLQRRRLLATVAIACLFEVLLAVEAGVSQMITSFVLLSLLSVGVLAVVTTERVLALVRNTAEGQMRQQRLSRYFSPQIAARLEHSDTGGMAGTSCQATILFVDLRDFTKLTEHDSGRQVVALLNEFQEGDGDHAIRPRRHARQVPRRRTDGLLRRAPTAGRTTRRARYVARWQCRTPCTGSTKLAPHAATRHLTMGIGVHSGTIVVGRHRRTKPPRIHRDRAMR